MRVEVFMSLESNPDNISYSYLYSCSFFLFSLPKRLQFPWCYLSSLPYRYYGVWLITRCGSLLKTGYNLNDWSLCVGILILAGIVSRVIAFFCMLIFQKKWESRLITILLLCYLYTHSHCMLLWEGCITINLWWQWDEDPQSYQFNLGPYRQKKSCQMCFTKSFWMYIIYNLMVQWGFCYL